MQRVGFVDGAIGGNERALALVALFPHIAFEPIGVGWPEQLRGHFDILIVPVASTSAFDMDAAVRRLKQTPSATRVIVVLRDADLLSSRRLAREGAADVLPAPVTEPALALSLERLLRREPSDIGGAPFAAHKSGQAVAMLKCGGGVGATALGVQVAAMLATRSGDAARVCLADLDLQFGIAALYLDLPESATITECIAAGAALEHTPFATALARHKSGASILAAPRELTPLESLTSPLIAALFRGLKRDFALSIVDLPSVWTTWTYSALQLVDRIVLVTHLSIPHIHLVRRQLSALSIQQLGDRPIILVCNSHSSKWGSSGTISLKAAERAIGRPFDVVIPEDSKVMDEAINHGLEISAVRRGTSIQKAIGLLADAMAADALTSMSAIARR